MHIDGLMPDNITQAQELVKNVTFPNDFLFGAATAAYQIEGGLEYTNWKLWEDLKFRPSDGHPTVRNHDRAGSACDSWNRFDEDLAALQHLGARMYRFSVDWSRIEPQPGEFNETALDQYASWCQQLCAAQIEPMVSLHHFVEPSWFTELGGFEKRENVEEHFDRFVKHVTVRLAPYCRYWATINEPNLYSACAWMAGVHPPGKKGSVWLMLRVYRNLLVAHTLASRAIRDAAAKSTTNTTKNDDSSPIICCPINYALFLPHDPEPPAHAGWFRRLIRKVFWSPFHWCVTRSVALIMNYITNVVVLDAMLDKGRFPWIPVPFQLAALAGGWRRDLQNLKGTVDWIGINHYFRTYVWMEWRSTKPFRPEREGDNFIDLPFGIRLCIAHYPQNFERTQMGWDLTPSSMERLLQLLSKRYPKTPILITESGTAVEKPEERVRYMAAIVHALHKVRQESNVDLRGYLVWTLLDNFEWGEGYHPRFGLLETNYETFERTERKDTCDLMRSVFSNDDDTCTP